MIGRMRHALQDRFPKEWHYAVADKQPGGEAGNRVTLNRTGFIPIHARERVQKNYQFFVNFLSTQAFIDALYR